MPQATDKITEKELQQAVVELAQYFRWKTYHTFDSRRSDPGFPDLVMVRNDRMIFAELKSSTGRVSTAQTDWLAAIEIVESCTAGLVRCFVWRPEDWATGEIERVLR